MSIPPASFAFPDDFPPELLTRILLQVPYWDLVRVVPLVSKLWKYTIDTDPALRIRTFKKAGDMYGDIGLEANLSAQSESLTLHPLFAIVSYVVGDDVTEIQIYPKPEGDRDPVPLSSFSAANDFATIPFVHTLTMKLESDWGDDNFTIDIENPDGITVLDVFLGLANGAQNMVDTIEGPQTVVDALGSHKFDPCSVRW
ncbi:hypothetical protein C8F01DRAFT_1122604 [Mycena amicta]|nr:hypothetical protein C8F01DRAFT_1122604 [Mycena amicta]